MTGSSAAEATHLLSWCFPADAPWLSPEQLSLLYLLNPFTILTCVAGSSTSAENMGVILAVAGGLMRNAPMAAAGVAVGTYMGLQPALLVVSRAARLCSLRLLTTAVPAAATRCTCQLLRGHHGTRVARLHAAISD